MVVAALRSSDDVERRRKRRSILGKIIEYGRKNRQLGMYLFIYYWYAEYGDAVDLKRLWRFYNNISDHVVNLNTVRKQLELLRNKGLVEVKRFKIYPKITDLEIAVNLFDSKRSRAGQRGARKSLRRVLSKKTMKADTSIPKNLEYYVERVIRIAGSLVKRNKRWECVDLLAHTLLPLRKTGVLWLWIKDTFIYYENKTGKFHSVRFPRLAEALRNLGFSEGLMVYHIFGHRHTSKILERIFGKGHLSWPWGRSIFYGLKKLRIANEGNNYIIELRYSDGLLYLWLKDLYGNPVYAFKTKWDEEPPQPLSKNCNYFKTVVLGKQHIKMENENSYFSKWRA